MATKVDTLAEKQRKQKKILIVLGVLLIALAAFQGPKLLKQVNGSTPAAAPAAAPSATDQGQAAATAAAAAAGSPATPAATPGTAGDPSASYASVTTVSVGRPKPSAGQLRAFTLFTVKDPFVQSLPSETSGATSPTSEPTLSDTQPQKSGRGSPSGSTGDAKGGDAASDGATTGSGSSQSAPPESAPQYATISVNGTPGSLELTDTFPEADPLFVLVSLKQKVAEIGIAGGKLTKGKTLKLKMGKGITLVNTATGARYALKLLYTGSAPEQVAEFVQGAKPGK